MKWVHGETPFPPCSARYLSNNCVLLVDGPFPRGENSGLFTASIWERAVLIEWCWGISPIDARDHVMKKLHQHDPSVIVL